MFKRIFRQTKSADLPHSRQEALKKIKKRLGWRIRDENIYLQSLKHRSASSTHIESNERLELLGDAVLGLLTCEHLYLTRPHDDEGQITEIRSLVVSKKILAVVARELGLGEMLELSSEEMASGGRYKESLLADVFESLIGAYYLDAGLGAVRSFLEKSFFWQIPHIVRDGAYKNYKGLLQEYLQVTHEDRPAKYVLKKPMGPEHHRIYEVELKVGRKKYGSATAPNKKDAEQMAAKEAIEKLKAEHGG